MQVAIDSWLEYLVQFKTASESPVSGQSIQAVAVELGFLPSSRQIKTYQTQSPFSSKW